MTERMWDKCPECGSEDWNRQDDWEYDEHIASTSVECYDCGCIWEWVYRFEENSIVVSGGRDDEDDFGEDTTSGSPLDLREKDTLGID